MYEMTPHLTNQYIIYRLHDGVYGHIVRQHMWGVLIRSGCPFQGLKFEGEFSTFETDIQNVYLYCMLLTIFN